LLGFIQFDDADLIVILIDQADRALSDLIVDPGTGLKSILTSVVATASYGETPLS
jgi:hypothetical protein